MAQVHNMATADGLLRGAWEVHVHSSPDSTPRSVDDVELVTQARDAGLAGLVLKCHNNPTTGRAYILEKLFPPIRVFGSVCLNGYTGGINPEAAEVAIKMGAKVVWMPTVSALNQHRFAEQKPEIRHVGGGTRSAGITVFQNDGRLKPEALEVFALVRDADVVLSTGHLSAEETVAVAREARKMGVKRVLLSHPDSPMVGVPVAAQQELAALGCYFDRCYAVIMSRIAPITLERQLEIIRQVGVETTILTSDYGQPHNPKPVDGFREYLGRLLGLGVTTREIETMVKKNPEQLLL